MDRGIAHGDGSVTLEARVAVPGRCRQIFQCAVSVTNPQVSSPSYVLHCGLVIAKDGANGGEVRRDGNLGHKQDRIGRFEMGVLCSDGGPDYVGEMEQSDQHQ